MNELYEWIFDDITWCANECENTQCDRNLINRTHKGRYYSAALFKDTQMCPLTKTGNWIKVYGYATAGGDPVYACSQCGYEHVYGIEHPQKYKKCPGCGSHNTYPDGQI